MVYRTRAGTVRVVDPYCPHLGAHLGFGATVDGENIVCPFHHFAYGPTGACVRTGDGSPPPRASLNVWAARETNGFVMIWRHAQGSAPTWEIPAVPSDGFPSPTHKTFPLVDHPQEFFENGVDVAHFVPIHGFHNAGMTHPLRVNGPRLDIPLTLDRVFPLIGSVKTEILMTVHGLGCSHYAVHIPRFSADLLGQVMVTPIDPVQVQTYWTATIRSSLFDAPAGLAARTLSQILTQAVSPFYLKDTTKDFPIWRHKRYVEHPKLSRGDGPIMEYRRWARQFYSAPPPSGHGDMPEPASP